MTTSAPIRPGDQARGQVLAARTSVYGLFAANGVLLATLLARIPAVRDDLGLTPQQLGLLLLSASAGSLLALPTAGAAVGRAGVRPVVVGAAVLACLGVAGAGLAPSPLLLATALFCFGFANGAWDVAMNVEAADVERALGTTIMPRFHGAWSVGTVAGAVLAVLAGVLSVGRGLHLPLVAVVVVVGALACTRSFLPPALGSRGAADDASRSVADGGSGERRFALRDAWTEPRTILIGVTMLGFALAEGIAGDWLALAVVDSREAPNWVGSAVYGVFLASVMAGRFLGPALLDRFGRYRPLLVMAALAGVGVLGVVFLPGVAGAVVGALFWGVGVSLGFPVGMSAAADDPARAAVRVSVVASIAYTAFLAGPPLVGLLGEHLGTDIALLTALVAAVLAASAASAMRPPATSDGPTGTSAGTGPDAARPEPADPAAPASSPSLRA